MCPVSSSLLIMGFTELNRREESTEFLCGKKLWVEGMIGTVNDCGALIVIGGVG